MWEYTSYTLSITFSLLGWSQPSSHHGFFSPPSCFSYLKDKGPKNFPKSNITAAVHMRTIVIDPMGITYYDVYIYVYAVIIKLSSSEKI